MWLNRYIDVVIVYYHCWILLASRTHIFLLIRNVPNSAIERPIAILQCSHLKLETTWLSLASWDISALYFSSRACIGDTSLHPSRSCKSETNHEHQKVKISRSACQKLILSGLRCVSLSGNWKNKGSSFMLSQEQPIMHHSQRDTNRLKTFKLLGNQSDFFRLFFLSFLEIVHSGSGVIQLLHVRIIHNYWAFRELPKAFAHMYDIVWSFYNERLICEAVWLRRYRFWHCIFYIIIEYCWPTRQIYFPGLGMSQKVP